MCIRLGLYIRQLEIEKYIIFSFSKKKNKQTDLTVKLIITQNFFIKLAPLFSLEFMFSN